MSELKRFTASQAREIMPGRNIDHFKRYMNSIYNQIELRAKGGLNELITKGLYFPSKMKRVIETLKEDGYKVQYDCMEDLLIVRW